MFLFRRPSNRFIERVVDSQRDEPLMYPNVGLTQKSELPKGFCENRFAANIGRGEAEFEKAKQALNDFRMLQLGWIDVVDKPSGIVDGELVATLIKQFGFYSLNVAKIVYTETDNDLRYGFGYGTLPEYPVYGEERFSVLFDHNTEEVSYEIFSFAKPATTLARLGWPFIRKVQKTFGPASCEAMRVAIV